MSVNSTLTDGDMGDGSTAENTHLVYRQISKVVLTNLELTEEIRFLRMRLALLENAVYSKEIQE